MRIYLAFLGAAATFSLDPGGAAVENQGLSGSDNRRRPSGLSIPVKPTCLSHNSVREAIGACWFWAAA
jgi:hypothetical protein